MRVGRLDGMVKGWFVGDFTPTLYRSREAEVAVKHYRKGEVEDAHYHKIATELTAVISGRISINNVAYASGDVLVVEPGEVVSFAALEDATTVVVKLPSVPGDKFPTGQHEEKT